MGGFARIVHRCFFQVWLSLRFDLVAARCSHSPRCCCRMAVGTGRPLPVWAWREAVSLWGQLPGWWRPERLPRGVLYGTSEISSSDLTATSFGGGGSPLVSWGLLSCKLKAELHSRGTSGKGPEGSCLLQPIPFKGSLQGTAVPLSPSCSCCQG